MCDRSGTTSSKIKILMIRFFEAFSLIGDKFKVAWIYLMIAGFLEVAWAIGLKYTDGWTRLYPSLLTAATMIASFYFLSLAVKTLPIGSAYAVWTGIGTVGASIAGIIIFDESRDASKLVSILLIVVGIVGLKLNSPH